MSADLQATEQDTNRELQQPDEAGVAAAAAAPHPAAGAGSQDGTHNDEHQEETEEEEDDDDDDDGDEEEEPKLKYAKLTGNLANVYRNGDSTSAFVVAGDKMVMGTHNGNIHVLAMPAAQTLRTYRAHQASVTSVSLSPVPPLPSTVKAADGSTTILAVHSQPGKASNPQKNASTSNARPQARQQPNAVPNTPNNQIYIATSSMDGHVCISSLVNPEDVQLRNFARPVNAVALSPEYKTDKTYLSGGLAGSLILTVGGKAGVSSDANTNSAATAASGWLSSIGIGSNSGQDRILHSGEGAISSIRWSLSGKWVAWVNEEGIKIMRSPIKLGSEDGEDAWKRIAHAARPNRRGWEEMSGVWKARCEWVDERSLELDHLSHAAGDQNSQVNGRDVAKPNAPSKTKNKTEKLVVGWGDTAWILHITPVHSSATTNGSAKRQIGNADIIHKLQFRDCIVSGISFYSPSLLAILAYRTRDDNDEPIKPQGEKSAPKGRQRRRNGLAPQLRLISVSDGEEVEVDELPMSRHEILSAQDYHLGTMHVPPPLSEKAAQDQQKGMLEGMFDAAGGRYATRIFSSGASILSGGSGGPGTNGRAYSFVSTRQGSGHDVAASPEPRRRPIEAHPHMLEPGLKIFIQSPYDCVLAVKQDISDHLQWLIAHSQYAEAWQLIDSHPEAVDTSHADGNSISSQTSSHSRLATGAQNSGTLADFLADDTSSQITGMSLQNSIVQREKRKIGDLWLQQLVSDNQWQEAGRVAGKILGTSGRWVDWVLTFAQAQKFDEITPYIPSTSLKPPLPSLVYEVILGHYIVAERTRLGRLLDEWDPELFDVRPVIRAIEDILDNGVVREDSVENGTRGRDWAILLDALVKLYLADGRTRDALRCCIQLQDADRAFALIREEHLLDAASENVPGLVMLRVDRQQMESAQLDELQAASSEAIQLLVDEAHRGTLPPGVVIEQLQESGRTYEPFLFFYFRALWNGDSGLQEGRADRRRPITRREEGHALVEENGNGDLAVRLFAEYDRELLLDFLRTSELYSYEAAAQICEERNYIPELVHILSKTGQTRQALSLIIRELGDVKQAIDFTKENARENADLWEDLLDYSMDRPLFVRGLLEEVGATTAFNPIDVVRRIPEGREIEGLKQSIQKLVREFEIQLSISEGAAKVLDGEVSMGMDTLRAGRRKGVRFEVLHETAEDVDLAVHDVQTQPPDGVALPLPQTKLEKETAKKAKPGHCVGCGELFHENEKETLIGFACGHVYHLSCLLAANPDTKDSKGANALLQQLNRASSLGEDEGYAASRPSVGGKVANAHSIKNVLRGGCQHCIVPEGA